MPLTETEHKAARLVAKRLCDHKEPTTHQRLLSEFKDPSLIIRLSNAQVFNADTSTSEPKYFPTALTFHHSGDDELLNTAKDAVRVAIRDAKKIFSVNEFDRTRRYDVPVFLAQLESSNYVPVPEQIALGLFLAKDIPNTIFVALDEKKTSVVSFQINEHILNQDPEKAWDNYVQSYDRIGQEDRQREAAELERQASAQKKPVPHQRQRTLTLNKVTSWLPPRWKIVESLGEGGQGWTYKVRRSGSSDKDFYVLKRPKNKSRVERFRREIAALKKLQHPSILRIEEVSKESEEPFFVSEFCEGLDLAKANLYSRTLESKLGIFRQVCDAIAAAHKAGILHRDMKPSNVFIRKDGSAVVGDFGLCIDLNELRERATETSEAVGARIYIAPELEIGRVEEPEASSDVYSLGKVFYFMVGARHLLREDYSEPEYDLRSRLSGPEIHLVYEIFDNSIRKNTRERFQNAGALLEFVDNVIARVRSRAHVLNMSIRQHCVYCGVGEYYRRDALGYEVMLVCNNCGNVQHFTSGSRKWW